MTHPPNPYVGPSPLTSKNKLYGRDQELAHLMDLLISERIVLLYSPSGAGKTSLLQAGLVPAIKERGFTCRNMIRVNTMPPPGLEDNRYSVSVMASLKLEGKPTEFGGLTLAQYLDPNPNGELLVFDQFEEVIATDPFNYKAKQRFFDELGEALRARGRWALFATREDYLARLDPYLRRVPTRLSNTFRLDLLSIDASIEAIRNPALEGSVPVQFPLQAAKKLAANLAGVEMDQSEEALAGRVVEPVQLQVACKSLWEKLKEGTTEILPAHIGDVANIDQALGTYYADSIEAVAGNTGSAVRAIRVWFGDQLINRQGIRVQVLEGDGLDAAAAAKLENEFHLVRSSERLGKTWIELAHDRLVAPVHANNDAWFEKHLTNFQRRALQWQKEKENPSLLMLGREVESARVESDNEERFLHACVGARKRRQTRRLVTAAVATVIAVLAAIAIWQGQVAKRNLAAVQPFLAQTMVDQALLNSLDEPERALAFLEDALHHDPESLGARSFISTILTDRRRWLPVATSAWFQADPTLKIIQHGEEMVDVMVNGEARASVRHPGAVAAKFSADQRRLFTRAADGTAIEWASTTAPGDLPAMATGALDQVMFSPDGQRVITRDSNSIKVWDWRTGAQVDQLLKDVQGTVLDVSAGGATALDDGSQVRIVDTASNTSKGAAFSYPATVLDRRATLSPTGEYVALFESGGAVSVWRAGAEKSVVAAKIEVDQEDMPALPKVSFSLDGRRVAIGGSHSITVFDLQKGVVTGTPIKLEARVAGLALSPDGKSVAMSADKVVLIWDVAMARRVSPPMTDGTILADVKFSADGRRVLGGSLPDHARLWDSLSGKVISIGFNDKAFTGFAFSPDGNFLALATNQVRVRRIWLGKPWGESSDHSAESELLADLAGAAGGYALNDNHAPVPLLPEWIRRVAALRARAERSAPNEPTVASFLREYFGLDRK